MEVEAERLMETAGDKSQSTAMVAKPKPNAKPGADAKMKGSNQSKNRLVNEGVFKKKRLTALKSQEMWTRPKLYATIVRKWVTLRVDAHKQRRYKSATLLHLFVVKIWLPVLTLLFSGL